MADCTNNFSDRQEKLNLLLSELCSFDACDSTEKQEKVFRRLEEIYYIDVQDRFRHYYSSLFGHIVTLQKDEVDLIPLQSNLKIIESLYVPIDKQHDVSKEIRKLYDHVNLDISRLNYINQPEGLTQSAEARIKELNEKVKIADQMAKETADKQEKMQTENVTILGIFAAIVFTFIGGLTFTTSTLEGIGTVSIYRLLFFMSCAGLILYNVLFALFYYIHMIVEKHEPRLKVLWFGNIVIFLLLVISVVGAAFNRHAEWDLMQRTAIRESVSVKVE